MLFRSHILQAAVAVHGDIQDVTGVLQKSSHEKLIGVGRSLFGEISRLARYKNCDPEGPWEERVWGFDKKYVCPLFGGHHRFAGPSRRIFERST